MLLGVLSNDRGKKVVIFSPPKKTNEHEMRGSVIAMTVLLTVVLSLNAVFFYLRFSALADKVIRLEQAVDAALLQIDRRVGEISDEHFLGVRRLNNTLTELLRLIRV